METTSCTVYIVLKTYSSVKLEYLYIYLYAIIYLSIYLYA